MTAAVSYDKTWQFRPFPITVDVWKISLYIKAEITYLFNNIMITF